MHAYMLGRTVLQHPLYGSQSVFTRENAVFLRSSDRCVLAERMYPSQVSSGVSTEPALSEMWPRFLFHTWKYPCNAQQGPLLTQLPMLGSPHEAAASENRVLLAEVSFVDNSALENSLTFTGGDFGLSWDLISASLLILSTSEYTQEISN